MRTRDQRLRWMLGFTLVEILAVTAIVSSVGSNQYTQVQNKALQTQCANNLQQIGQLIQMHVDNTGSYPKAVFYPKDVKGEDSIAKVIGGDLRLWNCPGLPQALQAKGLSFVYNDAVAGKPNVPDPEKTWLLIELCCVSSKAPAPHPGGYNILYADGHVEASNQLPPDLKALQK